MKDLWPAVAQRESRFTKPTRWCPHPERWHSTDDDSTEVEVSQLVASFVTALQPDLVFESGTAWGQTTKMIGDALKANGQGWLISCEVSADRVLASRSRCHGLPVEVQHRESFDAIRDLTDHSIGFAWLDSILPIRSQELVKITPKMKKGSIIGVHDCGDPDDAKFLAFSNEMAKTADRYGYRRIHLPTPRGVTFLQMT